MAVAPRRRVSAGRRGCAPSRPTPSRRRARRSTAPGPGPPDGHAHRSARYVSARDELGERHPQHALDLGELGARASCAAARPTTGHDVAAADDGREVVELADDLDVAPGRARPPRWPRARRVDLRLTGIDAAAGEADLAGWLRSAAIGESAARRRCRRRRRRAARAPPRAHPGEVGVDPGDVDAARRRARPRRS